MTIRYSLEDRQAIDKAKAIKRAARPPQAAKTKVVLPPRRKLTDNQKAEIHAAHSGLCYLCGQPVPTLGPEVQYDHKLERWERVDDSLENMGPAHTVPCHARKSAQKTSERAHIDAMGAKHRGEIRPKGSIKSAGFQNRHQPMRSR